MRASAGAITRTVFSKPRQASPSNSSGITCTISPSGAAASSAAARARTRGWVIALSWARAASSLKTIRAIAGRSSAPSGRIACGHSAAISPSPSDRGATTSRARTSASITVAPRFANAAATALLPEPIPPVSPTLSFAIGRSILGA